MRATYFAVDLWNAPHVPAPWLEGKRLSSNRDFLLKKGNKVD